MRRLGLIVNPIAGIGGRVGLKGSDGPEILARARALGAVPEAPGRAVEALRQLRGSDDRLEILTYGGAMGEDAALVCGFSPVVIGRAEREQTTALDTRAAAMAMAEAHVDLLLFAGGDGTARDVHDAAGQRVTALGIPAGVKIHSAVYAINPRAAGQLAAMVLDGRATRVRDAEVMDIDEEAFREGRVSAELHGFLRVPVDALRVQSVKAGRALSEAASATQIAYRVADEMTPGCTYVIGPGTTTRALKEHLGVPATLLGVDVVRDGRSVGSDVNEARLLEILGGDPSVPARIVVTVIGGQGSILGRGNQQISPRVIARIGRDNIRVIATMEKISSLGGRPLLVDTGDAFLDASLTGYARVVVGYNEEVIVRVASSP